MAEPSPLTEISDDQRRAFARLLMGEQPGATAAPDQPVVSPTYLNDLLTGQRTNMQSFGYGPLQGTVNETRTAMPAAPWEQPSDPSRMVDIGVNAGPVQAGVNAQLPSGPGALLSPGARVGVGPVALTANLDRRQGEAGDTVTTPSYGVGLKAPLFGGDASANFSVTPNQRKSIQAEYRKRIGSGEVGAMFGLDQPNEGRPDLRAGIFGGWRF